MMIAIMGHANPPCGIQGRATISLLHLDRSVDLCRGKNIIGKASHFSSDVSEIVVSALSSEGANLKSLYEAFSASVIGMGGCDLSRSLCKE